MPTSPRHRSASKRAILSAALAVAVVAGVSAATTSPGAPQACSLPGLWLGQDRNKDGVGMWLEFAPDGSVVRAQGRIVNGEYAIKGDALVLKVRVRVPAGNASVAGELSQRVPFKLAGAEMTRRAEQARVEAEVEESGHGGHVAPGGAPGTAGTKPEVALLPMAVPPIAELAETKLTKVADGDGGDRLSGVWSWTSKSSRTVLERFAGKRFAVLEPMGSQKGSYALEDNKLSVTADGTTTALSAACKGSMLSIEAPNGPMRFVKF